MDHAVTFDNSLETNGITGQASSFRGSTPPLVLEFPAFCSILYAATRAVFHRRVPSLAAQAARKFYPARDE
jgi:hypothetical protein